jgi:hypothetical protein
MNKPLDRTILAALRPSQERAKLCLRPATAFSEKTVAEICRDVLNADVSDAYKDALRCGKASDWSVRKVGDVLEIKAKWDALKAEFATIAHSKLALSQLEDMDFSAHQILSERVENVTEDEEIR